jgi:hypothetical protein
MQYEDRDAKPYLVVPVIHWVSVYSREESVFSAKVAYKSLKSILGNPNGRGVIYSKVSWKLIM